MPPPLLSSLVLILSCSTEFWKGGLFPTVSLNKVSKNRVTGQWYHHHFPLSPPLFHPQYSSPAHRFNLPGKYRDGSDFASTTWGAQEGYTLLKTAWSIEVKIPHDRSFWPYFCNLPSFKAFSKLFVGVSFVPFFNSSWAHCRTWYHLSNHLAPDSLITFYFFLASTSQ